jgi:hypothetical protein
MNLPWQQKLNVTEITQYTDDLSQVTKLRNHATDVDEIKRYDQIIECMQLVLLHLTGGKYDSAVK